ncbi:hypothetical protein [Enterobacter hormaechei]
MSKAIMQQTYNFEALHDKGLAEHFLNAGKHLSGEVKCWDRQYAVLC